MAGIRDLSMIEAGFGTEVLYSEPRRHREVEGNAAA